MRLVIFTIPFSSSSSLLSSSEQLSLYSLILVGTEPHPRTKNSFLFLVLRFREHPKNVLKVFPPSNVKPKTKKKNFYIRHQEHTCADSQQQVHLQIQLVRPGEESMHAEQYSQGTLGKLPLLLLISIGIVTQRKPFKKMRGQRSVLYHTILLIQAIKLNDLHIL